MKINKECYNIIKNILEEEFFLKHNKGGRKPKLTINDMISATIDYYSTNTTYKKLGAKYKIHESNIFDTINWVVNTLINKNLVKLIVDNKIKLLGLNYKELDKIINTK